MESNMKDDHDFPVSRRMLGMGVLLFGSSTVLAGNLFPYHRRAQVRCELPACYDFQTRNPSSADVRETAATLFLEQANAVANSSLAASVPQRRLRVWQVVDKKLSVDHCSLSNISVWIDENGNGTINLVAAQKPFIESETARQATPATRFLRNKFHVGLRAYGMAKTADPFRTASVGQPELFQFNVPPFWVERDTSIRHSVSFKLSDDQLQRLPRRVTARHSGGW